MQPSIPGWKRSPLIHLRWSSRKKTGSCCILERSSLLNLKAKKLRKLLFASFLPSIYWIWTIRQRGFCPYPFSKRLYLRTRASIRTAKRIWWRQSKKSNNIVMSENLWSNVLLMYCIYSFVEIHFPNSNCLFIVFHIDCRIKPRKLFLCQTRIIFLARFKFKNFFLVLSRG